MTFTASSLRQPHCWSSDDRFLEGLYQKQLVTTNRSPEFRNSEVKCRNPIKQKKNEYSMTDDVFNIRCKCL
jgi:hypothetical protein